MSQFDFGDLDDVRRELRGLASAATDADGQPHRGQGEAMEGMVKVTVTGGRITTVELNPRVMRSSSQELGEAFAEAANAALADLATKVPSVSAPAVDPAALEAQLAQVEAEARSRLNRFAQSVDEAMSRLDR